jgi:hypothetical protein
MSSPPSHVSSSLVSQYTAHFTDSTVWSSHALQSYCHFRSPSAFTSPYYPYGDVRRPRIRHPHGGAIRRCHEGWTGKPPSPLAAASALAWCLQRWASADRSRGPPSPSESQSYDLTRLPSADKCRAGARAASPQADAAPATRWLYTACDRPLISRVTDPGSSPRLEPRQPSCRARATRGARGETHRWR